MREAELSMRRRLAHPEAKCLSCRAILRTRIEGSNGIEEALRLMREVYSGRLRLDGEGT